METFKLISDLVYSDTNCFAFWEVLIPAAATLVSGLISNNEHKKSDKRNQRAQDAMNDYNSPENQAARLRAAGIAPTSETVDAGNQQQPVVSTPNDGMANSISSAAQMVQNGLNNVKQLKLQKERQELLDKQFEEQLQVDKARISAMNKQIELYESQILNNKWKDNLFSQEYDARMPAAVRGHMFNWMVQNDPLFNKSFIESIKGEMSAKQIGYMYQIDAMKFQRALVDMQDKLRPMQEKYLQKQYEIALQRSNMDLDNMSRQERFEAFDFYLNKVCNYGEKAINLAMPIAKFGLLKRGADMAQEEFDWRHSTRHTETYDGDGTLTGATLSW